MISNKKGGVSGFIIMIVILIVGLLGFVTIMPLGLPFIDTVAGGSYDPLTKFLFLGIPIFTILALIVGVIMN